jgi:hypothetical protein
MSIQLVGQNLVMTIRVVWLIVACVGLIVLKVIFGKK